jgi:hypothetical protein
MQVFPYVGDKLICMLRLNRLLIFFGCIMTQLEVNGQLRQIEGKLIDADLQ